MELRDFAEQVLFATTLEEKLQRPAVITDLQPGPARLAPQAPGRPDGLKFKAQESGQADFPGLHQLDSERARGRLLHFFANHELLATELMALVLLRFPDAPAAFRRGVLQTLHDEQEHTRLYLARMKACGIEFGELPVSGYFWRAVSSMETPVDYVAGLSLTFEQANLDFAKHFARGFAAVGDDPTARLLEKIHRDEIGHVAYGLKWFRRWKTSGASDWDAYCQQLKFPLSPQRAKGPVLNVEARRAAGFEARFIAELDVFAQSKGRTPNVFWFNPFAEAFIAQGRAFTPVQHQALLARDLANLPQFLGRQDDVVLVPQRPSVEFLSGLKQAGFALPEFVEVKTGALASLAQRKLGVLRPWAWGPDSVEQLKPLFASVTGEVRPPGQRFHARLAQLYSKAWSADFLKKFLTHTEPASWLCEEHAAATAVHHLPDALAVIAAVRARGHHPLVVKESLGLAGHNALRLWEPELLDAQRRWMTKAFERKSALVIEPWLERVADFSVQLEMNSHGLKLRGYTGLINDAKGQFQANWAAPNHTRRLPDSIVALFPAPRDIAVRLHRLFDELSAALEVELRAVDFLGPLGIDAFVYRDACGGLRLKPVVEINPRYTMGRLTVELMKHTCPGSFGRFRLINLATVRAEGFENFPAFAHALAERQPLQFEGQPTPRLRQGAVCLNDPATAQVCLAVFEVTRTWPGVLEKRR